MEITERSRRLMHFAEKLVTSNKADSCHNNTISFNNCMTGSYNSKYVGFNGEGEITNQVPGLKMLIQLNKA